MSGTFTQGTAGGEISGSTPRSASTVPRGSRMVKVGGGSGPSYAILLEDGSGNIELEDGSGYIELEDGP